MSWLKAALKRFTHNELINSDAFWLPWYLASLIKQAVC